MEKYLLILLMLLSIPAYAINNDLPVGAKIGGQPIASTPLSLSNLATGTANTIIGYNSSGVGSPVAIGSGCTLSGGTLSCSGSGGSAFSAITGGTNLNALLMGSGGSLGTTGSGTIAATTAAALSPGASINGVAFTGTSNITVPAAAGTLTGSTLASSVTASSITSIGNGAALQTPASITLTNGTGLPISTGVSGLGTGIATWAATPSGTNFAAALTSAIPLSVGGTNATTALGALVTLGVEDSANESHLIPHDTTANRPGTPVTGMFRFNTTTLNPEMYANGTWNQIDTSPIANNGILYNPTANTLPHLRTALANVVSNTSNAKILWIGTSTVSGYNTGGNTIWTQKYTEEYLLAQNLTNSYGVNANNDSIFGFPSAQGDPRTNQDPRLNAGSGWASDSIWSIGGPMFSNNSTTSNLSFTMPTTADRVTLWYVTDSAVPLGTFTWQVNSGSTTSINEGASSAALASVTITVTPGSNILNIARVSGTVKIVGFEPYLSTQASVDVINSGVGGVVAANFTGNGGGKPYGLPTVLATFAPAAIFVQMDNNDALAGTATATYKSQITSLLTGGATTTDPLLIAQEPCGGNASCFPSTLAPYIVAQEQVALASSLPFINQLARITNYDTVLTPLGYSNNDGLHADTAGYIDESDFLTKQTATIAGLSPLPNQDVNPALADAAANRTYTGTNIFSAANTFSNNNTLSGNNTFTGNNSHSAAETFTGSIKIPTTTGCPTYASTVTLSATSPNFEAVNTSTGAVTVNLPAAAAGLSFLVQDCTGNANTHNITVTPSGSDDINGVNSSETISTSYGASGLTSPASAIWLAN